MTINLVTKEPNAKNLPTLEAVTPEKAREWLVNNTKNRPINQTLVARYVQAMQNDQWELNGETVKFADNGRLLDGQHRLMAVVESGVTIYTFVVRGLPEEVFDTIDCGKVRTIADTLNLDGATNATQLGIVLRLLYVHDQFGSVQELNNSMARLITNRDLMETKERHPDIDKSVSFIVNLRGLAQKLSVASSAYCHYVFSKVQPHHADSFFIQLQKGTNSDKGHAIFELTKRLSNMQRNTVAGRVESIALTIMAWNAWRSKESVRTLSYDRASDFPVPE